MNNHDKILSKILLNDESKLKKIRQHRSFRYRNIYDYINNRYNDSKNYIESLYRIMYNIQEKPRCKCGKLLNFWDRNFKYRDHCSPKCAHNDNNVKEKYKKTCIKKYGVENSTQSKIVHDKMTKTCLERYGVKNPYQAKEVKEKIKQTCLERYGVTHHLKLKKFLDKQHKTNLEKYGSEILSQSEIIKDRIKKSFLEHYGVDNWSKSDIGKRTLSYIESLEEIKNKKKQTALKHYGVEYWQQSKEGREWLSYILSTDEVQQKMIETKRKNDTLGKSKIELEILYLIKEKFSDIEYQHRDNDRYPFNCDYYIPSLDLFIEYQGFVTHGKHPYNENNVDDINELNRIKSKDLIKHPLYKDIIENWTITDPMKRNIAKKNNLNYIEFWNIEEVKNWLKQY